MKKGSKTNLQWTAEMLFPKATFCRLRCRRFSFLPSFIAVLLRSPFKIVRLPGGERARSLLYWKWRGSRHKLLQPMAIATELPRSSQYQNKNLPLIPDNVDRDLGGRKWEPDSMAAASAGHLHVCSILSLFIGTEPDGIRNITCF